MAAFLTVAVLGVFVLATAALALYGLHLYLLVALFFRRASAVRATQRRIIGDFHNRAEPGDWPLVTSQIPLYNEADVAVRVLDAVARMHYPAGRHEIQVLDDSTDRTSELIDRAAERLRVPRPFHGWGMGGADVRMVRRPDRAGYKAGALAHGLTPARGEVIAIFDADFVPPPDFLLRMVPLLLHDPGLACVQARWAHLNERESWLTRAQALGIDGHFAIEQGARAWNGLLMNFNGTAGVWRRAAIEDPAVGGWSGDTLTEDLDLSYRAQLAGWRMGYALDVACPAELPGTIEALKSQQRRWATGSIQVACKLLPRIWRSGLNWTQKVEATLHLTHYSVALWMLVLALVARPMLLIWMEGKVLGHGFWAAWLVIILAALAPSLAYAYARHILGGGWGGLRVIPLMVALGTGLCLNNALAVLRGLRLRGGEFVRTPKSGSLDRRPRTLDTPGPLPLDTLGPAEPRVSRVRGPSLTRAAPRGLACQGSRGTRSYAPMQTHLWWLELLLGMYTGWSFWRYADSSRWAFSMFLLIYAVGFLVIGWASRPRNLLSRWRRLSSGESPDLLAHVDALET